MLSSRPNSLTYAQTVMIMACQGSRVNPQVQELEISLIAYFINSLVPGRCSCNYTSIIFILISRMDIVSISCETLVQVMAWCHQATSYCLSQCWPRCVWPYGASLGHNELIFIWALLVVVLPWLINFSRSSYGWKSLVLTSIMTGTIFLIFPLWTINFSQVLS